MLNTASLARVRTRTGRTRHGALAGLMTGSVMLAGATLLAGCSAGTSSTSAGSAGAAKAGSGQAAAPAPLSGVAGAATSGSDAARQPGGTGTTTARLAPAGEIIYTAQLTVRGARPRPAAAPAPPEPQHGA